MIPDVVIGFAAVAILLFAAYQLTVDNGPKGHAATLLAALIAMFILGCVCIPSFDKAAGEFTGLGAAP